MLDIDIQQARFINLGDWLANFSYGVFDGESFELKKVDEAQISNLRPVF
jgi:UDP-2,3-diacylglucosamine hydrolase